MTAKVLVLVAALAVSTAVGSTVGPAAGAAAQAAPEPTGWERMLAQQPLVRAADVVQAEVSRGGHAGFAGIVLEDDHVALWW